ncbi:Tubulin [Perkinsus chesapeaki]|uniref:Tubulin n=1 Tax=Perkinsus chesapeaki TaxID=330153 RepID=A0A7J6L7U7_PERCH|nr:Tubulin [Perkinsus chesapeaki]
MTTSSRRASYTPKGEALAKVAPTREPSSHHTEHVPLMTIQSLVRSAEATSTIDDDTLYNVCRMAVQHGRPRAHANALASMTRSRSTRGRLSYEELHHLMAATISGVEMCDYIPGPAGTQDNSGRSRRAQKVLVNFCPIPRMHYFYNALTLPEVSQNYFDDIYLRPSASLLAPSVPSSRGHHHHHHRIEATEANGCHHQSSSSSSSVGRRLSTVKGTENVATTPNASSAGLSETVIPSDVSASSVAAVNHSTEDSPNPSGASAAAAPANESGTAASDGGAPQ